MSEFKPMNECVGFNMERVLLKNKNGYMITAYYKDGMLQCDGDEEWTQPISWAGFIRLRDLANGVEKYDKLIKDYDIIKLQYEKRGNRIKNMISKYDLPINIACLDNEKCR
jgi:hypothetical protein